MKARVPVLWLTCKGRPNTVQGGSTTCSIDKGQKRKGEELGERVELHHVILFFSKFFLGLC